jgi:hypothetical protein
MCHQDWSPGNWIALGSLIVAAVGLYYLVRYVEYTKRISEEAGHQTEASFKPAIIAIPGGSTDANCRLRNVGKGPAMDVEWRITGTNQKGRFSCIEATTASEEMHTSNLKTLVNGALQSANKEDVTIICSYKSLSGAKYASASKLLDVETGKFSTTFHAE